MNADNLAKWLHDNYEEIARENNWNTQQNCKVEFNDLPVANKKTMISLASRIIDKFLKPNESKTVNRNENAEKICDFCGKPLTCIDCTKLLCTPPDKQIKL